MSIPTVACDYTESLGTLVIDADFLVAVRDSNKFYDESVKFYEESWRFMEDSE